MKEDFEEDLEDFDDELDEIDFEKYTLDLPIDIDSDDEEF